MKNLRLITALVAAVFFFAGAPRAAADAFKSVKECTAGRRVADKENNKGTVVRISQGTLCMVKMDETKRETAYIFWMLHADGSSAETDDKLVPGIYECFAGGHYTFMDMAILSANTYESAKNTGKFHVEASRKIVFETGPLSKYHAKLLAGPSIGLNTDGGTFYATTCELNKG